MLLSLLSYRQDDPFCTRTKIPVNLSTPGTLVIWKPLCLDPSDGVFGRFDLAALCGCHTLNVCCCCCCCSALCSTAWLVVWKPLCLDPSDGVFGRFDLAALCGCHTLNVCCCCCHMKRSLHSVHKGMQSRHAITKSCCCSNLKLPLSSYKLGLSLVTDGRMGCPSQDAHRRNASK